MKTATVRAGGNETKLLVIDERGQLSHRLRADLPSLVRPGDLVVANDAATLPASLQGTHARSGEPVEVRLAGHSSFGFRVRRFTALVFGSGDYRTPTERRPQPPALSEGDELRLGSLRATVAQLHSHPRLVDLRFEQPLEQVWEGLARHGRPIQYAYVLDPLPIWDTWTSIASRPVAFEAPSAGFLLDWAMLRAFRSCGVHFATLTHAAGISSTGDDELDRLLPFDESFLIPAETAALVHRTKQDKGRIIAVGTTVVRALEAAGDDSARVRPGPGLATGRIDAGSSLRIVDALVSGIHEPGTSHYQLLRAFQSDERLEEMTRDADAKDYRLHEFGDAVFIENDRQGRASGRYASSFIVRINAIQRAFDLARASSG